MTDAPLRFLIVEADPFVALDLAESIRDCAPAGPPPDLVLAATLDEAVRLAAAPARLCAAFVRAPARAVSRCGLDVLIAEAGGQLVLVGGRASDLHGRSGWLILDQPFTSETVRNTLAAMGCLPVAD